MLSKMPLSACSKVIVGGKVSVVRVPFGTFKIIFFFIIYSQGNALPKAFNAKLPAPKCKS